MSSSLIHGLLLHIFRSMGSAADSATAWPMTDKLLPDDALDTNQTDMTLFLIIRSSQELQNRSLFIAPPFYQQSQKILTGTPSSVTLRACSNLYLIGGTGSGTFLAFLSSVPSVGLDSAHTIAAPPNMRRPGEPKRRAGNGRCTRSPAPPLNRRDNEPALSAVERWGGGRQASA